MYKFLLFGLMFCYLTFVKANHPGYLGISVRDFSDQKIKGVQVVNVFDDGAAKLYGVKENDIITTINNVVLLKRDDLLNQLARYNWSDKVHLNVIRNGMNTEMDVYLGYKSTTRTYIIKKISKDGTEHWFFDEDKTDVIVNEKNELVSISKEIENGNTDVWKPQVNYKDAEVPQYFLDTEDKLYCIKRIKEEQLKSNSKANDIVFIKTISEINNTETAIKKEWSPENFSISPNPNNGMFFVDIKAKETGKMQLTIFDVKGKIIRSENRENFIGEFSNQYNLQYEAKGAYLILLKIGELFTTKKIILQ